MYSTAEVAETIGVSKNTLLRWIAEGRLRDVQRDWRNWREWTEADLERARQVRDAIHGRAEKQAAGAVKAVEMRVYAADMGRLAEGRKYRA